MYRTTYVMKSQRYDDFIEKEIKDFFDRDSTTRDQDFISDPILGYEQEAWHCTHERSE